MMANFEDLKLTKSVQKALTEIGFINPTPIQEQAIPIIKAGKDVLGIAQTGTGKTAAYLLPVLTNLVKAEGEDPRVIVLVPTRELSIQVGEDLEELAQFTNIRHVAIYGGIGWTKHAEMIAKGIDVLIATPGRLMDLYNHNVLSFKKVKTLVIDEADRMLDMGFMPQLRKIFEVIPPRRQNLLFSATFSEKIEHMTHEFLTFPERIEVAPSATPVELVKQIIYHTPNFKTKLNLISNLLIDEEEFKKVIIFCKTKIAAEEVFKVIKRKSEGEKKILHSNKAQSTRINAINAFKNDEIRILISTDLSARGIDASKVTHVINFDVPVNYDDYIHRIGRTARAGNQGVAITLLDPSEEWHFVNIEKIIRMSIPVIDIPEEVEITETEKEERQEQLREIDHQKRVDDPTFKGAFHEKKRKSSKDKRDFSDKFVKTKFKQVKKKRGQRMGRNR
ncbi:MAG: DEAD/DEAH box helicase [Candidatus Cloacimonetes bacterium]|nr:DEAD/DEAH box helicase [Candidatus Cloacimonadota bacterium]